MLREHTDNYPDLDHSTGSDTDDNELPEEESEGDSNSKPETSSSDDVAGEPD
ncbi:hypothetical protein CPC08DRAFT_709403 [Agrocybe pediades]|nr:hypothetical protein CPC08DRAFT_709403 [Agrocybe pediades]